MKRSITILAFLSLACDPVDPEDDGGQATTGAGSQSGGSQSGGSGNPTPMDCEFHCFQPQRPYQFPAPVAVDAKGMPTGLNLECSSQQGKFPDIDLNSVSFIRNPVSCTRFLDDHSQILAEFLQDYAVCGGGGEPLDDLNATELEGWESWANRHARDLEDECAEVLETQYGCVVGSNFPDQTVGSRDICKEWYRNPAYLDLRVDAPAHDNRPSQEQTVTVTECPDFMEPLPSC